MVLGSQRNQAIKHCISNHFVINNPFAKTYRKMNHPDEKFNYLRILSRLGGNPPVTEEAELCTLCTYAPLSKPLTVG
jgi:hypothetical protein